MASYPHGGHLFSDSEYKALRNVVFFLLRNYLTAYEPFNMYFLDYRKYMSLKITMVSGKRWRDSSIVSNWKWENKVRPLRRVERKWERSFCDHGTECFNREKPVLMGPLIFVRPIKDIISFDLCRGVSPLHKWEKWSPDRLRNLSKVTVLELWYSDSWFGTFLL